VRVFVVMTPYFNAIMAPNGMMQIWTGLLLRCENEAQLAAVLGHELGHYIARHGLARLKDAKSRSTWASLMMAVPIAGPLAAIGTLSGGFAYSRDQEREADHLGLDRMAAAGYPPLEAPKVWGNLMDELAAEKDWSGDAGQRSALFATHPPEKERKATLEALARSLEAVDRDSGADRHRQAIASLRGQWLRDELKRRRFGESVALLARLSAADPRDGEARYFLGEAYRLRNAEGDAARAAEACTQALALAGTPPEAHRTAGFLHQKGGRAAEARQAFSRYLELRPDAEDADMIRSYLKEP
jgi:predicted Zn-dependent protease